MTLVVDATMPALVLTVAVVGVISYLVGSIPNAYIIVRAVTGEDVTAHGTGNVGAMNVRRSTGSWSWFAVAMIADAAKGFLPVLISKLLVAGFVAGVALTPASQLEPGYPYLLVVQAAVFGAVLGHNYSAWLAVVRRRFTRTGKGLATGGGALLAYDWRYFMAVLVVGTGRHRHHEVHDGGTGGRSCLAACRRDSHRIGGLAVHDAHGRDRLRGAPQAVRRDAPGTRAQVSTSTTAWAHAASVDRPHPSPGHAARPGAEHPASSSDSCVLDED